jgi:hypothetical protein
VSSSVVAVKDFKATKPRNPRGKNKAKITLLVTLFFFYVHHFEFLPKGQLSLFPSSGSRKIYKEIPQTNKVVSSPFPLRGGHE